MPTLWLILVLIVRLRVVKFWPIDAGHCPVQIPAFERRCDRKHGSWPSLLVFQILYINKKCRLQGKTTNAAWILQIQNRRRPRELPIHLHRRGKQWRIQDRCCTWSFHGTAKMGFDGDPDRFEGDGLITVDVRILKHQLMDLHNHLNQQKKDKWWIWKAARSQR